MNIKKNYFLLSTFLYLCVSPGLFAQQNEHPVWQAVQKQTATLGIDKGYRSFQLQKLKIKILNSSQTLSSLQKTDEDDNFDYTPAGMLNRRDRNNFFHFGDINLRIRKKGEALWST